LLTGSCLHGLTPPTPRVLGGLLSLFFSARSASSPLLFGRAEVQDIPSITPVAALALSPLTRKVPPVNLLPPCSRFPPFSLRFYSQLLLPKTPVFPSVSFIPSRSPRDGRVVPSRFNSKGPFFFLNLPFCTPMRFSLISINLLWRRPLSSNWFLYSPHLASMTDCSWFSFFASAYFKAPSVLSVDRLAASPPQVNAVFRFLSPPPCFPADLNLSTCRPLRRP